MSGGLPKECLRIVPGHYCKQGVRVVSGVFQDVYYEFSGTRNLPLILTYTKYGGHPSTLRTCRKVRGNRGCLRHM